VAEDRFDNLEMNPWGRETEVQRLRRQTADVKRAIKSRPRNRSWLRRSRKRRSAHG
jgi:hypothetical protein